MKYKIYLYKMSLFGGSTDDTDNISNDYGKMRRNELSTRKIISLTILVIILTLIVAYIFYYLYTNCNNNFIFKDNTVG